MILGLCRGCSISFGQHLVLATTPAKQCVSVKVAAYKKAGVITNASRMPIPSNSETRDVRHMSRRSLRHGKRIKAGDFNASRDN